VEYKTIYRPYKIPVIIKMAKSPTGVDNTNQESRELKDWNTAIKD
jgi:hypothetical protein